MKFYLSPSDYSRWSGISRSYLYKFEHMVMNVDLVDVIATSKNMIEDAQSKPTLRGDFRKAINALEQKIIALEGEPKRAQKVYFNTSDLLDRLQFGSAAEYAAFIKANKATPPEGVKVRARAGGTVTLFDIDEIDEFMEQHRRVGLSMKYAKKFIKGEYAPGVKNER